MHAQRMAEMLARLDKRYGYQRDWTLEQVYQRLAEINADTAEARASSILTGASCAVRLPDSCHSDTRPGLHRPAVHAGDAAHADACAVRRLAHAHCAGAGAVLRARPAAARRADQPPHVSLDPMSELSDTARAVDINATVWLENYLMNWTRTLLVVSHNRDFLNNVAQQMVHFVNKGLVYYKGNYDNFEMARAPYLSLALCAELVGS
jgi:hypothetical protein